MRYRLTPFHFVATYFFAAGIYDFYFLYHLQSDTELGELFPYLYMIFGLLVVLIDFAIQFMVQKLRSRSYAVATYTIEIALIVASVAWGWLTFFPSVHHA